MLTRSEPNYYYVRLDQTALLNGAYHMLTMFLLYHGTCSALHHEVMVWGTKSSIYSKFSERDMDALITFCMCAVQVVSTKITKDELDAVFYNVAWTYHDHSTNLKRLLWERHRHRNNACSMSKKPLGGELCWTSATSSPHFFFCPKKA